MQTIAGAVAIPACGRQTTFTQQPLLDLAGRRLFQCVDGFEKARHRVARQTLRRPCDQCAKVYASTRRDEVRLDFILAARTVDLDADHGAFCHLRMGKQHLLDLKGGDVFAAATDAVAQPVDKMQLAAVIEKTGVAGVKPQIAPGVDGRLRHLEITLHEGVAA